jgi:hypothetical protein
MFYDQISTLRDRFGSVYVTAFPDGPTIPWKPLSLGDYIKFNADAARGLIPQAQIENEIFRSCVLDQVFIQQLPFLKAGIVTTVVSCIWQHSGPTSISSFNADMEMARQIIAADGTKALHQVVQLITMAFPYKPEEVYEMPYETLLLRAAQAETKLLETGMISQPIMMQDPAVAPQSRPKRRVDAREMWEQQQAMRGEPTQQSMSRDKWWDISPMLEAQEGQRKNIDFQHERDEADDIVLDNHERTAPALMRKYLADSKTSADRAKMIEEAQEIYKDALDALDARYNK